MKLAIVEKKTFLAGLQCTLTSSCAKNQTSTSHFLIVQDKHKSEQLADMAIGRVVTALAFEAMGQGLVHVLV